MNARGQFEGWWEERNNDCYTATSLGMRGMVLRARGTFQVARGDGGGNVRDSVVNARGSVRKGRRQSAVAPLSWWEVMVGPRKGEASWRGGWLSGATSWWDKGQLVGETKNSCHCATSWWDKGQVGHHGGTNKKRVFGGTSCQVVSGRHVTRKPRLVVLCSVRKRRDTRCRRRACCTQPLSGSVVLSAEWACYHRRG